jgi:gliding motility-associated-like protein
MTIFSGESVNVVSSSSCASSFSWNSTAGFDDPNSVNPVVTPLISNTYILSFDYGNCDTQDSIRINVLDANERDCAGLLLPKAFTPNNDGLNDTYGISNDFLIDELIYFEIYDRWGTKVFETNDLNAKWDGRLNGIPINATAFVYKVKYICLNEEQLAVGNFSILR